MHEASLARDPPRLLTRRRDALSLLSRVGLLCPSRHDVSQKEVMELLESAGFSRSNPYYIVPQGQVLKLYQKTDAERLELLKEVAGTRVYEKRREESLRILQKTRANREKIDEITDYIAQRMQELEAEKQELKEYQELDALKRALQYTLYKREADEARSKVRAACAWWMRGACATAE